MVQKALLCSLSTGIIRKSLRDMEAMVSISINSGLTVILSGIYLWCVRKQDRTGRIMGLSFFLVAGCFVDSLCGQVMEGILDGENREQMRLAGLVLSKSIMGIFLLVIYGIHRENTGAGNLEVKKGRSYLEKLAAAGTVFFWCVLTVSEVFFDRRIWCGRDNKLEMEFTWTLFLFIVLLGFYFSVYWHRQKEHGRQEEKNRQEERRQAEVYLCTIESNYQRTRELWHDLRNHISLLQLLLQEEKYEQMRDYLRIFGEEADKIVLPVKSGNVIVDAVLADKTARAKQENIAMQIELCDLKELAIKPDEICSLLGNLLDNAIEACLRVDGERKIAVTCRMRGRGFSLSVRNTVAAETVPGGPLVSSKRDRENVVGHGLGLRSVERVVNRYAGELVTDIGDGMFTIAVWLPEEGENRQETDDLWN